MNAVEVAAKNIWEAMRSKSTIAPVRELIGATDIDKAYEVQRLVNVQRTLLGRARVGCKIGLTSSAVQKQLGVDQPDYGLLFDDMRVPNNGELHFSELVQPRVEAEVAFVLDKDINDKVDEAMLAESIAYASAAIEIVGSRVRDWDICITDTIADNASASHFVLSETRVTLEEVDLIGCKMALGVNNTEQSTGVGSACMGSPQKAALWVANTMIELNEPLKEGDIILSGALGPMVPLHQNDIVRVQIEGLGVVGFTAT